jgi:DNA-binding transcriptional MerR regulator
MIGCMVKYTIKQIADLAGVTSRTLRYYDQIGLLPPTELGDNGYRYYTHESLLQLQQILFFRELDVPLNEIGMIMHHPDFNLEAALLEHKARLQKQSRRLDTLIDTIERTIANLQGDRKMEEVEYFEGFDQSQYEEEVRQRWGETRQYAESRKKWASYSKQEKEAIKAEGGRITTAMVGENPDAAPDDPQVQQAIGEYFSYLNKYFYSCDIEFLRGLADMWEADPRFAVNYERIRPGGAAFVRDAVHIYCDRNE